MPDWAGAWTRTAVSEPARFEALKRLFEMSFAVTNGVPNLPPSIDILYVACQWPIPWPPPADIGEVRGVGDPTPSSRARRNSPTSSLLCMRTSDPDRLRSNFSPASPTRNKREKISHHKIDLMGFLLMLKR